MSAKVIVRDLRKKYGGVEAARGVGFQIEAGEIFGLLGPNGAGKTTTLECILGLREPDAGSIEVCGIDARTRPREVKQKIGAALQITALQDKITPREVLSLFATFYENPIGAAELLKRFSLTGKADDPVDALSGGQRQRLALALAFVNRPELVFLDEPTTGLDPQSRREMHNEIRRMKQDGHTVLLTTHYIEEAEELCDRIAILASGRIIATGAPRELIDQSRATQAVHLTASRALTPEMFAGLAGVQDLVCEGAEARFGAADTAEALRAVTALLESRGVELVQLQVRKATLEDVFLELTGTSLEATSEETATT